MPAPIEIGRFRADASQIFSVYGLHSFWQDHEGHRRNRWSNGRPPARHGRVPRENDGRALYSEIDEEQRRTRAVSNEVSLLCLPGVDTRIVNTWNVWQWYRVRVALGFWMWRMIFHFREYSSRHFFLMIFFVTIRNSNCCCTVRECVHCGTKKFAWLFFNRMEECLFSLLDLIIDSLCKINDNIPSLFFMLWIYRYFNTNMNEYMRNK